MYHVQIKSINPSQESNHVGNSWIIGNRKFHTLHDLSEMIGSHNSHMVLDSFSTLTCEYSILDGIMYLVQITVSIQVKATMLAIVGALEIENSIHCMIASDF
jgi:hypothetical protein